MTLQYQGYYDEVPFDTFEDFVQSRLNSSEDIHIGGYCPVTEYTWSVIEDGEERNPTDAEYDRLYDALYEEDGFACVCEDV